MLRNRHIPRVCHSCGAAMASEESGCWRCGAAWAATDTPEWTFVRGVGAHSETHAHGLSAVPSATP